jgi:hypothetical protein
MATLVIVLILLRCLLGRNWPGLRVVPGPPVEGLSRLRAHFTQRKAMATFGLLVGVMFIFVCYLWNITDGEWPSGW